MNFLGLIGLGAGGVILFCLGKSTQGTQAKDISATGDASAKHDSVDRQTMKPPQIGVLYASTDPKATNLPVARTPIPLSVAKQSIYAAYTSSVVPQTRRFQAFS